VWAIARIAPPDGRMARVDALTERNKSRGKGRYHQQMTPICQSGNFAYQLFILRPSASNGSVMEGGPNPAVRLTRGRGTGGSGVGG
jgi:hypothetical protein